MRGAAEEGKDKKVLLPSIWPTFDMPRKDPDVSFKMELGNDSHAYGEGGFKVWRG